MSEGCIDCGDCIKNVYPFPECFTGLLHIATGDSVTLITFEKAGGGRLLVEFDGSSDEVDVDFATIDADFFQESVGLYVLKAFNAQGEQLDIIDNSVSGVTTTAECVLIYFKAGLPDSASLEITLPAE